MCSSLTLCIPKGTMCSLAIHLLPLQQAEFAASLFSGMSVSGEKKSRPKPVKQVKKPVKQVKPVAPPPSSFEDLLGLVNELSSN